MNTARIHLLSVSFATVLLASGCQNQNKDDPFDGVYLKLPDHTILHITQKDNVCRFSKTSIGYGQKSGGGGLVGIEASASIPVSGVYHEINRFELMAMIDGDWQMIDSAVRRERKIGNMTVDPRVMQKMLEPIALAFRTGEGADIFPADFDLLPSDKRSPVMPGDYAKIGATTPWNSVSIPDAFGQGNPLTLNLFHPPMTPKTAKAAEKEHNFSMRQPIFIAVGDGSLLRIDEREDVRYPNTAHLEFSKSAPGYAQSEQGIQLKIVEVEVGGPVANVYGSLKPQEVLAHFDGNWEEIYIRALCQYATVDFSIDPGLVAQTLQPFASNSAGEIDIKTVAGNTTCITGPTILKDNVPMQFVYEIGTRSDAATADKKNRLSLIEAVITDTQRQ